jgi:hypothetical protein
MTAYSDAVAAMQGLLYTGGIGRITPESLATAIKGLTDATLAQLTLSSPYQVVKSITSAEPGSPAIGDTYVVPVSAISDWTGHDNALAQWTGSAWVFTTPLYGFLAFAMDSGILYEWSGSAWVAFNSTLNNFVGIGNAAATIASTSRVVGSTTTLTASRTWTLPSAASVGQGGGLRVLDFAGVVGTYSIVLARASTDTINGATSISITAQYGGYLLTSDGSSKWNAQALGSQSTVGVSTFNGRSGGVTLIPSDIASVGLYGAI